MVKLMVLNTPGFRNAQLGSSILDPSTPFTFLFPAAQPCFPCPHVHILYVLIICFSPKIIFQNIFSEDLILFYSFFTFFWYKILFRYKLKKFEYSLVSGCLFSVFLINQASYGLWQSWWISVILLCIIFFRLLECLGPNLNPHLNHYRCLIPRPPTL